MQKDTYTSLPVVVYIHGGEFQYGGKDFYHPDYLLEGQDIVLVTINYRLGVLGWLGTDDEEAPGNYGLRDMIQALRWVKEYIGHFGGDPSRITAMGHEAGAIGINLLMYTQEARGMINSIHVAIDPNCSFESLPRPLRSRLVQSGHSHEWISIHPMDFPAQPTTTRPRILPTTPLQ